MNEEEYFENLFPSINEIHLTRFTDALGDDIFHYQVTNSSRSYTGYGSDKDENLAMHKAYAEFIERRAFSMMNERYYNVATSSGFAVHPELSQAYQNAKQELIERDVFLTSWLKMKSPAWLSENHFEKYKLKFLSDSKRKFSKYNFEIKFGIIGIIDDIKVSVAAIFPKTSLGLDFGFCISTKAHPFLDKAFEGCISDLRRMATVLLNRKSKGLPLFEPYNEKNVKEPAHHMEFYLAPKNTLNLEWYFQSNEEIMNFESFETAYTEIKDQCSDPRAAPNFFIVFAHSKECQNYFCGPTNDALINHTRLKKLPDVLLNYKLHPLG